MASSIRSIRPPTPLKCAVPRISSRTSFHPPIRLNSSSSSSNPSASVSPSEISHFNALASTWWDPHGSSRLLHLMNPLRHDFINTCRASQPPSQTQPHSSTANSSTIPNPQQQKYTYLDIGCGGGIFAESAARLPTTSSVTAIDPSPSVLSIAQAHSKRDPSLATKLTYLNTSIESLPLPSTSASELYDVVTLFEVIEHVNNPEAFLDHCTKFVKPGGWFVISTIARHWISWLTTKLVAEGIVGVVPWGTHDWEKYIDVEELRGYFGRRGAEGWGDVVVVKGVVYVPGIGWREVSGSERVGNYFLGARRDG